MNAKKNKEKITAKNIGNLPDHWTLVNFEQIVKKSQYGLSLSSEEHGNIPIIGMANIQAGILNFNNMSKVKIDEKILLDYSLKKNDLLFNRTNSEDLVGKTTIVKADTKCVYASYLVRFQLKSSVSSKFVYYYFNSGNTISRIRRLATPGVSQWNINPTTLQKHLPIPLPPLSEQKKIAEILSTWDKAIEQTKNLIEAKKKLKKGLMQKLLTGLMRFPEFGKPAKKGNLPKRWENKKLREIASVHMGTSPSSLAYNTKGLGLPLIQGNADISKRKSVPKRWTTEITTECSPGDILITVRAPVGEIALSMHHACVGRGAAVIKPKSVNTEFLYQRLLFQENNWDSLSQGSTFGSLSSPELNKLNLEIPQLAEQKMIASFLRLSDAQLYKLNQKLALLQTQKKGLLQKLLTGQIRVRVDSSEPTAKKK